MTGHTTQPCGSKVRLRDVLKPGKTTIDYLYDFGDSWDHRLTVTKVRPGEPGLGYPPYIAGDHAGPPEFTSPLPRSYSADDSS